MYRFFGDQDAYSLFNSIGFVACMISSLFYFKSKQNAKSLYSRYVIHFVSRKSIILGKIIEILLLSFESLLMTYMINLALGFNRPFGNIVGTGANYFGGLFSIILFWFILCVIFIINPLKQIDIVTMGMPVCLFFVKLACFLNGCCWGIPWEYGPYNHHYDHPGNQVPVQLIEAFWALAIFIFLLCYRKKAKDGTVFPMYVILYSSTRFCSEFLRHEDAVFGILKIYHILCIIGFVVGFVMLLLANRFRDKVNAYYDKKQEKIDLKIAAFEDEHKEEWERQASKKAKKKEKKQKFKEKEKKNKKHYAKSRKL